MKSCHICEYYTVKNVQFSCKECEKIFCHTCITRYFPLQTDQYIKNYNQNSERILPCFVCKSECKCKKCTLTIKPEPKIMVGQHKILEAIQRLTCENQIIPETGIFKNKKISQLPLYLQRVYLRKKMLYSIPEKSISNPEINIGAIEKSVEPKIKQTMNKQNQQQNGVPICKGMEVQEEDCIRQQDEDELEGKDADMDQKGEENEVEEKSENKIAKQQQMQREDEEESIELMIEDEQLS